MAAFVIGHMTVKDPEKWMEYRSKVSSTLVPWGGEIIFRGRRVAVLSGKHPYVDAVVLRFPDAKAAEGWYGSPAYQALIPLRQQAADMILISYEA